MNIKKDYFLGGGLLLLFALLTWSVVMQVAWV
ncbi:PAP2 family protein, partial [Lacticaseibacillus paracasei]